MVSPSHCDPLLPDIQGRQIFAFAKTLFFDLQTDGPAAYGNHVDRKQGREPAWHVI
jgi:hypothetical protein